MRTTLLVCLAAAWLAGSGCWSSHSSGPGTIADAGWVGTGGFWSPRPSAPSDIDHLALRNLSQEPVRWCDEGKFKKIAYESARAAFRPAWDELCRQHPEQRYSKHFAAGFLEGYVDYLDAGGAGEPPVAAPFRYRLMKYKTPDGVEAAQSWFAGFRYGAAVARDSHLRDLILVPLSGPILGSRSAQYAEAAAGEAPGPSGSATGLPDAGDARGTSPGAKGPHLPPPTEALPAPRELPDKGAKAPSPWHAAPEATAVLGPVPRLPPPAPELRLIATPGGTP
jgi:hypothetical protein